MRQAHWRQQLVCCALTLSAASFYACGDDDKSTPVTDAGASTASPTGLPVSFDAAAVPPTQSVLGDGSVTTPIVGIDAASPSAPTTPRPAPKYVLGSVVIGADDERFTYVQAISSLDAGPFKNKAAIEFPGNGTFLPGGKDLFVGLAQQPTWVKYSLDDKGALQETGRMSLLQYGVSGVDYGNAYVDAETAVSVLSAQRIAVIWNPTTMEIKGEVSLAHLQRDGFELEVWTTGAYKGLVYIPGRWADWTAERILPTVSLTILDPKTMKVVGVAEDDRCASGGQVVFDDAGYAYVMGDGRTHSIQTFALAHGEPKPKDNCLLRIAPGQTDFDADYFHTIPSITGGLQSITELGTARQGSGLGFSKMFDPGKLTDGLQPISFDFWSKPAHRLWRLKLSDPPTAEPVNGLDYSAVGFGTFALNDRLYTGETPDGSVSDVYEIDPQTNQATKRFSMTGYFVGLFDLSH